MKSINIALAMPQLRALLSSFGQSILSLSFNFGGLLAGSLAVYFSVFSMVPWAIALFPGILSVRGSIGGLFSGHLSTGLHLGTVKDSYTRNTESFYTLLRSVTVLSFISGLMLGLGASVFGVFLWGASAVDFVEILAVVLATMGLSVLFVPRITLAVSVFSFRRGLDPDVILYPVISTVADILVTVCYAMTLVLLFSMGALGSYLIWIIDLVFVAVVVYLLVKNLRNKEFIQTIKEFLLTIVAVTFIVNVAGSILVRVEQTIGNRPEVYAVYPALIDTVGDVGSIIGSTATTKLALGSLKPSFSSIMRHLNETAGAWLASIVMFMLYNIVSLFTTGILSPENFLLFSRQLLAINIIAVAVMLFIVYAVAVYTFRRGWNPDNFVIPIESSLADTVTTAAILISLALIV